MNYRKASEYEKIKYNNLSYKNFTEINDFVALDIETTGLRPNENEIINIGAIRFRNNMPMERFNMFIKPNAPIPALITDITGISNGMVKDSPKVEEVLPKLLDFIGEDIIIGHNVRFDLSFINYAMELHGINRFITSYVDTLAIAKRFRKNNKLENLVRDYVDPDYVEMHQGLDDALNTARIFYVFKRMTIRGQIL